MRISSSYRFAFKRCPVATDRVAAIILTADRAVTRNVSRETKVSVQTLGIIPISLMLPGCIAVAWNFIRNKCKLRASTRQGEPQRAPQSDRRGEPARPRNPSARSIARHACLPDASDSIAICTRMAIRAVIDSAGRASGRILLA